MKAVVYKSTGSWYQVKGQDGVFYQARLKGVFKLDELTSTNPLVVGDNVQIETTPEGVANIEAILPRRNHINRQSPTHRYQQHIIAANVDQILLLASLKNPRTSQGLVDRFLVTAEAYHIAAVVVLNKSDLYGSREMETYRRWREIYEGVGYPLILVSVARSEGLEPVNQVLQGKVTLISGPSGVGKSSLINTIFPARQLKTQQISQWSGKGMHTTTFAEMFDLPLGGALIDTPGIREFGLMDIHRQELGGYFPEMRKRSADCQFNNCLHLHEPGCAIKKALEEGEIFPERYESYVKILESI